MASYVKGHESLVIMKSILVNKRHKRNIKNLQNSYAVFRRRMCKNYIGFGVLLLLDSNSNVVRCIAIDCMLCSFAEILGIWGSRADNDAG